MTTLLENKPVDLYISTQSGGEIGEIPERILQKINTNVNGYLRSRDGKYIFQYTDRNELCMIEENIQDNSENTNKLSIKILPKIENNIEKCNDIKNNPENFVNKTTVSSFLGAGANTVVLSVDKISPIIITNTMDVVDVAGASISSSSAKRKLGEDVLSNTIDTIDTSGQISLTSAKLLIKMFNNDDIMQYIEKWKQDKLMFGNKIIDIFLFGTVYDGNSHRIAEYIITREYQVFNIKNVNSLYLTHKLNLIIDLLNFCSVLQNTERVCHDIKIENIGFTEINGTNKIVIIDYDNTTILDTHDVNNLHKLKGKNFLSSICGSYMPPYAHYFYFKYDTIPDQNKKKLQNFVDKLMIGGIVDVINCMFIEGVDQREGYKLSEFVQLCGIGRTKSNSIFSSVDGYNSLLNKALDSSIMVFSDDHARIILDIKNILKTLLNLNYNNIPSYCAIAEKFNEILKNVIQTKSSTHIATGGYKHKYLKYVEKNKKLVDILETK